MVFGGRLEAVKKNLRLMVEIMKLKNIYGARNLSLLTKVTTSF